MSYRAKAIAGGKFVIPKELRREDADAALKRVREAFRGYSVDQFLCERRAEWRE